MDISLFIRSLIVGFSIAAPVGPIGVLCIRRTLNDGRAVGFYSGLGAATADAFYGCVAAFGLTLVSDFLIGQKFWLGLVGGLFLLYLGARTFIAKPANASAAARNDRGLLAAYASTLFLTLTNPATILSFIFIFAGLGFVSETQNSPLAAIVLVSGVFSGSALWWLTLSIGAGFLREKFNHTALLWVNRVSGMLIMLFGVIALATLFS